MLEGASGYRKLKGELNRWRKFVRAGFNSDRKITVFFQIYKFFSKYFFQQQKQEGGCN